MELPRTDETKRWIMDLWNAADSPISGGHVSRAIEAGYRTHEGRAVIVLEIEAGFQVQFFLADLISLALDTGYLSEAQAEPAPPKKKRK